MGQFIVAKRCRRNVVTIMDHGSRKIIVREQDSWCGKTEREKEPRRWVQQEKDEFKIESKQHASCWDLLLSYVCVCISLQFIYSWTVHILALLQRLQPVHAEQWVQCIEIELSCAWLWLFISFDYFIPVVLGCLVQRRLYATCQRFGYDNDEHLQSKISVFFRFCALYRLSSYNILY